MTKNTEHKRILKYTCEKLVCAWLNEVMQGQMLQISAHKNRDKIGIPIVGTHALMMLTASSSVSTSMATKTGPKISS